MCGIAGFSIAPGDLGKIDTRSMTVLLGYEMMSRGKDATGIYTADVKGRWKLRKRNLPADVFLAGRAGIGCSAQSLLLHTRAATQGKPHINGNNHPIQYSNIIGIHNGIIWNDDKLFDHYKWPRLAEVDSEAIFAALQHLPQREALENIDGGWAIAWADTADDPRKLWLARGSSSPLHYATTENGSVVFASTSYAVKEAFKYGGITGDPEIHMAPEGFLAHIVPDGTGLIIHPPFDGSGDNSIGHRTRTVKTTYTPGAAYGHAWSGGADHTDDWLKGGSSKPGTLPSSLPTPFQRITITGIASNPKVNDRRKYVNRAGEWIYEICTSVSPACWAELHESKVNLAHPPRHENGEVITKVGDGFTVVEHGLVREKISVGTSGEAVVLPFREPASGLARLSESERDAATFLDGEAALVEAELRYGYANPGDLICIPKKLYGSGNDGGIIGIVTDVFDDEILVEWRSGRLNIWDEYDVLIRAQKGT